MCCLRFDHVPGSQAISWHTYGTVCYGTVQYVQYVQLLEYVQCVLYSMYGMYSTNMMYSIFSFTHYVQTVCMSVCMHLVSTLYLVPCT